MDSKKQGQGRARSRSRGGQKIYKNPYLNFLRDFRKSCSSMEPKEIMIRAGKVWRGLPADEKQKYIEEASQASRDTLPSKKNRARERKETQRERQERVNSRTESDDGESISSYDSDN
ncbi:uncharacterized protein LOC124160490 [Ischnura elegans]|uniref:uncharacterized protein LOC124160490 n=1 Tax=Ischnura elegans TaxID=197161 RepID=UPI001ED8A6F5|nr:uncharacterized protein LOC124160490 [Ischnura elegans]